MRTVTTLSIFEDKKCTVDIVETIGDMERILLNNKDKFIHLRDKMLENFYRIYPQVLAYIKNDVLHIELIESWKLQEVDYKSYWEKEIEKDINTKFSLIRNAMDLAILTAELSDDCPVIFSGKTFTTAFGPYTYELAFYISGKSIIFAPWITDFYEGNDNLGFSDYYTSLIQDGVFEKVHNMLEKLNVPYWTLAKDRPEHLFALYAIHKNDMNKLPHYLPNLNTEGSGCLESYLVAKNAYYLPVAPQHGYPLFRARTLEWIREIRFDRSKDDPLWIGATWKNHNGAEDIIPNIGY